MKNKKLLPIPKFKNEDAERDFWDKADTSLYFDWSKARHVKFPNLKFSTETISLRVPANMLDDVKIQANKRDVPYQSLIKLYISGALEADKINKFHFAS
ncbi:MAG: BrnA antitoxin family protein [Candidatus Woesearchaeota archaeon]|jgi:predicted DNA binding CopG/RHH family protein